MFHRMSNGFADFRYYYLFFLERILNKKMRSKHSQILMISGTCTFRRTLRRRFARPISSSFPSTRPLRTTGAERFGVFFPPEIKKNSQISGNGSGSQIRRVCCSNDRSARRGTQGLQIYFQNDHSFLILPALFPPPI